MSLWLPTASHEKLRTRTISNCPNPEWNESFNFQIQSQVKVRCGGLHLPALPAFLFPSFPACPLCLCVLMPICLSFYLLVPLLTCLPTHPFLPACLIFVFLSLLILPPPFLSLLSFYLIVSGTGCLLLQKECVSNTFQNILQAG